MKFKDFLRSGFFGGLVGFFFGLVTFGSYWAAQLGWLIGSFLAPGSKPSRPILDTLYSPESNYGAVLPRVYGQVRVKGIISWWIGKIQTKTYEDKPPKFYTRWATYICEGPIVNVRRIWLDNILIIDNSAEADADPVASRSFALTRLTDGLIFHLKGYGAIRIHFGDANQEIDLLLDDQESNVSKLPGIAYAVFMSGSDYPSLEGGGSISGRGFNITKFGGRIPLVSFEVVSKTATLERAWELTDSDPPGFPATKEFDIASYYLHADSYVIGGTDASGATDAVYTIYFDDDAKQVGLVRAADLPVPLSNVRAALGMDGLTIIGGETATGGASDVMLVNPETVDAWLSYDYGTEDDPLPRRRHGFCYAYNVEGLTGVWAQQGGRFLVLTCGYDDSSSLKKDCWVAYTAKPVIGAGGLLFWEKLQDDCGVGSRTDHFMLVFGGDIYLLGGTDHDDYDNSNSVYKMLDTGMFTQVAANINGASGLDAGIEGKIIGATVYRRGDKEVLAALINDDPVELWESEDGSTWTQATVANKPSQYSGRPGFFVLNNKLAILGGEQSGVLLNDLRMMSEVKETVTDHTVQTVVTDLCSLVGLSSGDLEFDAVLGSTVVRGFVIAEKQTVMESLRQLRQAYHFDIVQSGDKIKFLTRGGSSVRTLDETDLGFEAGELLKLQTLDERSLPKRLELSYIDSTNDYQVLVQAAERFDVVESDAIESVQLPVVLTTDEAAQKAEILLWESWLQRSTGKIKTKTEHLDLEPCDVVSLDIGNYTYRARLGAIEYNPGGFLDCDVVLETASIYSSSATGAVPSPNVRYTTEDQSFRFRFLDIPAVREQDVGYGFYVGLSPVVKSPSRYLEAVEIWWGPEGEDLEYLRTLTNWTALGAVDTALGGGVDITAEDLTNTLTVRLYTDQVIPVSADISYTYRNLALVGSEIIQFRTVTDNGDGTYTLSGLWRGLFGTHVHIDDHSDNEEFILLTDETGELRVNFLNIDAFQRDLGYREYKLLPPDWEIEEVDGVVFHNTQMCRKAYPVYDVSWEFSLYGPSFLITWMPFAEGLPQFWTVNYEPSAEITQELVLRDKDDTQDLAVWRIVTKLDSMEPVTQIVYWREDLIGSGGYSFIDLALSRDVVFKIYQVTEEGRGIAYDLTVHS